jgi:Uma2 family endonuclease
MATAIVTRKKPETFADLLERLGEVPPERIRMQPPPGTAKESDLIAAYHAPQKRLCELVDGVLVEKAMGIREGLLAGLLLRWLWTFIERHDLGIALGGDTAVRLFPRLVRIPDLSFISWDQLPGREIPEDPIPDLAPDLAVEVISKSNTPKEMARKLREYFEAGVRLVWYIYPKKRLVEVYTDPKTRTVLRAGQKLDGGDVLPGFSLPIKKLFASPAKRRAR